MITGLHHVGLSVLNLDAAIDFVNAYAPGRTLAITGPWRSVLV